MSETIKMYAVVREDICGNINDGAVVIDFYDTYDAAIRGANEEMEFSMSVSGKRNCRGKKYANDETGVAQYTQKNPEIKISYRVLPGRTAWDYCHNFGKRVAA